MQPCGVCGGQAVDAAGYCTQCRTFRGLPAGTPQPGAPPQPGASPYGPSGGYAPPVSGPGYAPPASGPGYAPPASGPGYAPPVSGPGYPPPASGSGYPGPGYPPVSGAGYADPVSGAGYSQPPPGGPPGPGRQRSRSSFMVPLIALSVALVVLVVAIVVVVVARSGSDSTEEALVDSCVVGTWRVTRHEEDVAMENTGKAKFVGQGTEVRLAANGTGTTDYKDGTSFTATADGVSYTLVLTGTVRFDYRTSNGTLSFSNVVPDGKAKITRADTGQSLTEDLTGSSDPARYTCVNASMTEFTDEYRVEMSRISKTT